MTNCSLTHVQIGEDDVFHPHIHAATAEHKPDDICQPSFDEDVNWPASEQHVGAMKLEVSSSAWREQKIWTSSPSADTENMLESRTKASN